MQTHITPNNKLASFGTIGLLFLAGIAGMVFLLPAAHAASPTVTLSTISGLAAVAGGPTELTGVTSGTVASFITITGTGFSSNSQISITSTVGTTTVDWLTGGAPVPTCAGIANGGVGSGNSLYTGAGVTACLTTTAEGMFKVTVSVPTLPGGAQTIVVTDGTNTVSTPFTINSKVSFSASTNNYGYPEQTISGTLKVSGFGAGETVTIATAMWSTTSFTCTTGSTAGGTIYAGGAGTCTAAVSGVSINDQTGGAKTITATGATSALTASTTFTIKPWAAFYNSAAGKTTFSFIGSGLTSLFIEVHGMAAGTVGAGQITVGGVATTYNTFTIGSSGAAGVPSTQQIVVSPTSNVPYGNTAVVVAGVTFNYATGNIAIAIPAPPITWGGALISSTIGTGTTTGVVTIDKTSYMPGTMTASTTSPAPAANQVGFFVYGFVPSTTVGASTCGGTGGVDTFGNGNSAVAVWSSGPTFVAGNCETGGASPGEYTDSNGAVFAKGILGENPWSTVAAPTTAASYIPTITESSIGPANTLYQTSFGITPWIDTSSIASVIDYSTSTYAITVHGFGSTDVVTVTIGGSAMLTGGSSTASATGMSTTAAGKVPDLAAGPQNVVASGSVSGQSVTLTGGATYDPRIDSSGSGTALNIVAGSAGSTTILRTGTTFGAHGLYANTAYNIVYNGAGVSPIAQGTVIGTFTSTATGGIPVPGVQMTIPADTSGIHNIDLQRVAAPGTSFMYGNTLEGDWVDADAGLGATYVTQFGDMLFNEGTTLVATPTVANVGGTTTITGSGLQANTLYDLGISIAGVDSSSPAVPTTCSLTGSFPASPPTIISGQFTSTSTGTVPSGVSVTITDTPTFAGEEQGTLYCIFAQTAGTFGTTTAAGTSQFLLEANAILNATSGPVGHNFIETAHGLNANHGYNILFAPYACGSSGAICGTVVGAILTNAQGAGSATFTIPSAVQTPSGSTPVNSGTSYSIQLQATGSTGVALAIPPNFAVTSGSTTSCNTTACMTANGSPTQTTIGNNKAVQTSYTNNSNAPLTAIVYAVVHNAAGQTVSYSTATLTLNAGQSGTAYDILFGLPPGTYSVSVFVTTTGGVAISQASTATVTI